MMPMKRRPTVPTDAVGHHVQPGDRVNALVVGRWYMGLVERVGVNEVVVRRTDGGRLATAVSIVLPSTDVVVLRRIQPWRVG